jgi:3-methyladenine DNA glycosylase/8-oxoguanine DNA glycosylase
MSLPVTGAYDSHVMRAWLAARAIDGVETVTATGYQRTASVDGVPAVIGVTWPCEGGRVDVCVTTTHAGAMDDVVLRLTRVLDLDRDLVAMRRSLAHDAWLARLLDTHIGLRVPGGWDPFELAVRAVLGQQVTIGAARQLASQLVTLCGTALPLRLHRQGMRRLFPTPTQVASADLGALRMPGARRVTLTALAQAVADDPGMLAPGASLDAMIDRLRQIKGVGDWTAHYIALRALRHPDAFPASDIGLLRGAARETGVRPSPAALLARADTWRPCRAYAAQLLWAADNG